MFYSKSANGFYSFDVHGEGMPPDVVEITRAAYLQLLDDQSKGRVIKAGPSGLPVSVPPADLPAVAPKVVSMYQARAILIEDGLIDEVEATLAAIEDPVERRKAQNEWEYRQTVEDDSPLVLMLAERLELDLPDLFLRAGAIK